MRPAAVHAHVVWTGRTTPHGSRHGWTVLRLVTLAVATVVLAVSLPVSSPVSLPVALPETGDRPSSAPPVHERDDPAAVAPLPGSRGHRVVTAADPLRVWIGGDSMWERAGPALASMLEATDVADVQVEVRYSTGLTRPDFFDWSARVAQVVAQQRPEVVLFLVGANDSQTLTESGVAHAPGTDGFASAYEARAIRLMRQLAADGREVLWVGLPVMRGDDFDARMTTLTLIQQGAAAEVPGVQFRPTRALFTDPHGGYAATLPDETGAAAPMRGTDGIHLSDAGGRRLARYLFDLLDAEWQLGDGVGQERPPS